MEDNKTLVEQLREMVEKLREGNQYPPVYADAIIGHLCVSMSDARALFDRLTDLIEPDPERTCLYEHIEGTWYKTSCGKRYDGVVPPNYCPNCGAKVTG